MAVTPPARTPGTSRSTPLPVDSAPTVNVRPAQDSDAKINIHPWTGEVHAQVNPVLTFSGGQVGPAKGNFPITETWQEAQERPYTTSFRFTGSQLALQFVERGQTGFRIRVDGKDVTGIRKGNQNTGQVTRVGLQFRDARSRLIQVDTSLPFLGLAVPDPEQVQAAKLPVRPRAVFLGDSHTEGTGADAAFSGWAAQAGQALGWDTWVSGRGGTGYVNPGPPKVTLGDRLERDVLSVNPDIVVVAAGANDSRYSVDEATAARLGTEARAVYARIRKTLPKAKLIVVGPFWRASEPDAVVRGVDDTIRAAAQAEGATFIDALDWTQGHSEYMWTDGAHFNQEGHDHLAGEFVKAVR